MNERWTEFIEEVTKVCKGTDILTSPEDCLIYSHGCYPREYKWLLKISLHIQGSSCAGK